MINLKATTSATRAAIQCASVVCRTATLLTDSGPLVGGWEMVLCAGVVYSIPCIKTDRPPPTEIKTTLDPFLWTRRTRRTNKHAKGRVTHLHWAKRTSANEIAPQKEAYAPPLGDR